MNVAALVSQILEAYEVNGKTFSNEEWGEIAKVVEVIPPFPRIPGPLFLPTMGKVVPACVELVLIRNKRVLLTYRNDKFFTGYHTPGTYIAPGETWQQAAQRCSDKEINVKIISARPLMPVNHPDSPRFHDLSNLIHCEFEGEPKAGKWFSECPIDLIEIHKPYWRYIEPLLF